MPGRLNRRLRRCVATVLSLWIAPAFAQAPAAPEAIERGRILFSAGGCANCHTDTKAKGPLLAGGRAMKTPFGTFYTPNITPDPTHGIGRWSDDDFVRAMRDGTTPDGSHYFPVFPYTSFTFMTEQDMKAIKAYIFTVPPVPRTDREHDVAFPFSLRFGQFFWKMLFFDRGPYRADPAKSEQWNRGAYLARAVAHCGECHTPRNLLGGLDQSRWFLGAPRGEGPEGLAVPGIRSDGEGGISKWTREQIVTYLGTGETPDGDFAGSLMAEVIEKGTDQLPPSDLEAIAAYLKDLPPIRSR